MPGLAEIGLEPSQSANTISEILNLWRNARRIPYAASASNETTTGSIDSGSNVLTPTNLKDFKPGQGIFVQHAGAACGCEAVTGLTATQEGTTGSTTIEYAVVSLDGKGGCSAAATVTITNANATLSTTNYVKLDWTAPTSGANPTGYAVLVKVGSGSWQSMQLLPILYGTNTVNDTGIYYAVPTYIGTAPPTAALSDWLSTTIKEVTASTIILNDNAPTSVTDDFVGHDDSAALNTFFDDLGTTYSVGVIPPGDYWVSVDAVIKDSTTLTTDVLAYGATFHALPGTQANALAIIDSNSVRLHGATVDGNMANIDNSGGEYTTICGLLVGSYTEGTGGCTDIKLIDITGHDGYFGGIVVNTSTHVDIVRPYSYSNRDNAIFGRPHNNGVRVISPRATGSLYNGVEFIHCNDVMLEDVVAWDNGPSPYSTEGSQIGFEGCIDCSVNGAELYQSASDACTHGFKVDYTVEGGSTQRSSNIVFRNVRVRGIGQKTLVNGIVVDGSGFLLIRSDTIRLEDVEVDSCYDGWTSSNDATYQLSNLRLTNVVIKNSTGNGADISATNGSGDAVLNDCEFSDNGSGSTNGLYLDAWDGWEFHNCRFTGNTGEGLHITNGTGHKIQGGLFKDNTDNGILVAGSTGSVDVLGVVGTNTTAGSGQARLLYESASGSITRIIGCEIDGQATEPYHLQNADSYAIRNTGGADTGRGNEYNVKITSTSAQQIFTWTPDVATGFTAKCSLEVVTATTTVTVTLTWTTPQGNSATYDWISSQSLALGVHALPDYSFGAATSGAITLTVTAGTANQVYATTALGSSS